METRHLCYGVKYEHQKITVEMSRLCILQTTSDDSIVLSRIWRLLIESIMFVGTFSFLSNCDTEDDGSGKEDDPIRNAK